MPDTTKQRQCKNCGLFESDPDVKNCARCGLKMYVVTDPDNPPAVKAAAEASSEPAPPSVAPAEQPPAS